MKDAILSKILIFFGSIFLIVGIVGIFLPILPTTPFLLLTAACYARGSEKFYNWLVNNICLGKYIKNYQEGRGIPLTTKMFAITFLWITISFSIIVVISNFLLQITLIIIANTVTIHILTIKTMKKEIRKTKI
jgi:hypothetical protein